MVITNKTLATQSKQLIMTQYEDELQRLQTTKRQTDADLAQSQARVTSIQLELAVALARVGREEDRDAKRQRVQEADSAELTIARMELKWLKERQDNRLQTVQELKNQLVTSRQEIKQLELQLMARPDI